jgi:hypothetical protein
MLCFFYLFVPIPEIGALNEQIQPYLQRFGWVLCDWRKGVSVEVTLPAQSIEL